MKSLRRDDGKWKSKNEMGGHFGKAAGTSRYHYADLGSNIQHTMHPNCGTSPGVMDSCHSQVNADTVTMCESVQVPKVEAGIFMGIFIIAASSVEVSGFGAYAKTQPRSLGKGINAFLPELYVGPSKLHGFGLFCKHALLADTWLTEYSGEYLSHRDAKVRMAAGTDTHFRTVITNFVVIDGSFHGQFDMKWYCDGHKGGSLVNASRNHQERNATHVLLDLPDSQSYIQPYDWEKSTKSWGSTSVSKRIFLKTTKFVPPDEEIIVDNGVGYYARHPFTDDQE